MSKETINIPPDAKDIIIQNRELIFTSDGRVFTKTLPQGQWEIEAVQKLVTITTKK